MYVGSSISSTDLEEANKEVEVAIENKNERLENMVALNTAFNIVALHAV